MPIENNFQHDELSRKNPGDRLTYADWTTPPDADSPAWEEAAIATRATARASGHEDMGLSSSTRSRR